MNIGMLWFDNDPKAEIDTKIERAANYYQHKYGKAPNICFIHPSMLPNAPIAEAGARLHSGEIEIRSSGTVQPNHFWLGMKESSAISQS
jgi:hypothetical protein